jgi:hypothetical protein
MGVVFSFISFSLVIGDAVKLEGATTIMGLGAGPIVVLFPAEVVLFPAGVVLFPTKAGLTSSIGRSIFCEGVDGCDGGDNDGERWPGISDGKFVLAKVTFIPLPIVTIPIEMITRTRMMPIVFWLCRLYKNGVIMFCLEVGKARIYEQCIPMFECERNSIK